jgi:hypothetical protein
MPRLKTKDPPELIALRTEIAAGMAYLNINRTELAKKTGINYNTLSLRFSDLGSMRMSELWAIRQVFKRGGYRNENRGAD